MAFTQCETGHADAINGVPTAICALTACSLFTVTCFLYNQTINRLYSFPLPPCLTTQKV